MAYITKYGSFWGQIPHTNGNVFWVAPSASYTVEGRAYSASNDNDGLSPERAKLTLAGAISAATASVNDVIVLLPGAHSWTAQVDVNKAGLTIMGLPGGKGHPQKKRTTVTISAADEVLGVTAANVEIAHLHFIAVTAQGVIEFTNAADYLYIHDCSFDMFTAAASTSTIGLQSIASAGGVQNLAVDDCYFETLGAQGPYMQLGDVTSAQINRCTFRHTGSTALADGITSATGAVDIVFDGCRFITGTSAVITDAFDWTGNTTDLSLQVYNCILGVGSGINGSADADIVVNGLTQLGVIADGSSSFVNNINAS